MVAGGRNSAQGSFEADRGATSGTVERRLYSGRPVVLARFYTMDSGSDGEIRRSGDGSYRERGEVEAERYRSRTRSQSRSGSAEDSRRGVGNRSEGRRERDRSPEIEQESREQLKNPVDSERKVEV